MKRFLSISLLFIYSLAFSGMVIKMHFCGGNLESWNINQTSEAACCCDAPQDDALASTHEAPTEDDCCSNKSLTLKVNDDYSNTGSNYVWQLIAECVFPINNNYFTYTSQQLPTTVNKLVYYGNAPPVGLWQNIPLYKLQSKYLIYDALA